MATMTEAPAATLTYEAYMAEPEVQGRYDIVNGVRIIMPGATWDHQTIAMNLVELLPAVCPRQRGRQGQHRTI